MTQRRDLLCAELRKTGSGRGGQEKEEACGETGQENPESAAGMFGVRCPLDGQQKAVAHVCDIGSDTGAVGMEETTLGASVKRNGQSRDFNI